MEAIVKHLALNVREDGAVTLKPGFGRAGAVTLGRSVEEALLVGSLIRAELLAVLLDREAASK